MASALRFPIDPRMVPVEKVARRLGVTVARFGEIREALEANGFPHPDPIIGNYCLQAVDAWVDARSGLTKAGTAVSDPSIALERIRQRAWAR
ncbi:hypothetical protein ABMA46_10040 [Mesorhizobium sp. CN5-321]|uniref:hypothetical protein n=1 Tax=Mesorhizobium hunchu TaxID=3157708 RepID=UPI0032B80117